MLRRMVLVPAVPSSILTGDSSTQHASATALQLGTTSHCTLNGRSSWRLGGGNVASVRGVPRTVVDVRHRKRARRRGTLINALGAALMGLFLLIACDGAEPEPFDWHPAVPLTAQEFAAIGIAGGAEPLPAGTTAAAAFNTTQERIDQVVREACGGPNAPGLLVFSAGASFRQVPAYELLFRDIEVNCQLPSVVQIDSMRGQIAARMANSQETLDSLLGPSTEQVNGFCGFLQDTEQITPSLVSSALQEVDLVPENASKVVEIGISVLIYACPELLR